MVICFQNAMAPFNRTVPIKWSSGFWTVGWVGSCWGGEKTVCGWIGSKCSKEQRLKPGTLQAKGWILMGTTYPHVSHMTLECIPIPRAIWRNWGNQMKEWITTIPLQVKHAENVLQDGVFRGVFSVQEEQACHRISASTLFTKSHHDGLLIYTKRTSEMDPSFFSLKYFFLD